MSTEKDFLSYTYSIIAACIGLFVSFSGYCAYKKTKQTSARISCSYELFESHLIKILQKATSNSATYLKLCQLSTPNERRDFFLSRIDEAYKCIINGKEEEGIDCIIQAMAVCSKPVAVLRCLSKSLPNAMYLKTIKKLTELA